MKKTILLICFCLIAAYSGFSQTIFSENFQSAWTLPSTLVPAWSGTADPNSWHMNTYGTGWPYTTTGGYTPGGANNTTQSARFNTYGIAAGGTGDLITPTINLSGYTAGTVYLKFSHINPSGTDVINVYVSDDNGSSWSTALAPSPLGVDATWAAKAILLPGNSATTKIKFTGTSDYGNDDMGIDEVRVCLPYTPSSPPLTFTPSAITVTGMTIGWTDNSTDEIGFRVYRSTDNITFVKIGSDIASTTVAGTGTAYSQAQTGLVPGTTYYYKIVAYADFETAPLTGTQATTAALLINSVADGAWSNTATWSTGSVPTAGDFVTIQNNVNVDVATAACYKLTINLGSTLSCTGTTGVLTVGSDLTNNGALNFWTSAAQLAGLTFIEPNNNTFSGTGTTNINTLIINKGTTKEFILEMNLPNFTVRTLSSAAVGFLTLTRGTLKVSGTNTFNGVVFTTAGYSIGANVGFWLNNPNFTVNGQNGSPSVAGLFRLTQGTVNIGTATGNSLGFSAGATVIIEGGAINATGRVGVAAAANTISYTQTAGTITVCKTGNTSSTLYNFDLGNSMSSTILWNGGTVIIEKAASNTAHPCYRNDAGGDITGGTLQIGDASSGAAGIFNIFSCVPNLVIDPTYAHAVTFTLSTTTGQFYDNAENITIGAGTSLNVGPNLFFFNGTTFINNGTLVATGASTRLYFSNALAQTYSGTGVATAPVTSLDFDNDVSVTFSQTNNMVCSRIDLFAGNVFGSNKLTLGNGGAVNNSVQIGSTTVPLASGSFDVPFTFNLGTLGEIVYYLRTNASRSTGPEINPARTLAYMTYDDNDVTHSLTIAGGALSTAQLVFANGLINTSAANLLTVTGTTAAATSGGSATAYVNGPLALTLPASLATGNTFVFPVGKSAYKPLELVNPLTDAAGTVVVQSEVFDANCGGTPGAGLGLLNTNRYWKSSPIGGAGSITGTTVRLTESGLTVANAMAKSGTVSGTYNLVSSIPPAATTVISDNITSLGYFAVGTLSAAVSGTLQGTVTDASANPIAGATVSFSTFTTTTAVDGTYQFLNVFNGTYSVTCSKTGYITSTDPSVVVTATLTTIKNFSLAYQLDAPINLQGSVQNSVDAHLTWLAPGSGTFQDGFESYTDFAISFPPWINTDVDLGLTYGITDYTWTNTGAAQSFIVFNSNTTTPAMPSNLAHTGDKFAACFATVTASAPNNDWLISPSVYVVTGSVLKFWARSYVDTYGLERFKVGISTTGTATTDFSIISAGSYVEAPLAWTEFTYDLSAYVGQNIHVSINCVSNDAFIFMLDDFSIGAPAKNFTDVSVPAVNPFQTMEQPRVNGRMIIRNEATANYMTRCKVVAAGNPTTKSQVLNTSALNNNVPLGPWTLTGYNIYRDNVKINGSTPVTDLFYNDLGLPTGTYQFGVKAVYPQGESAAAGPVSVTISLPVNLTALGSVADAQCFNATNVITVGGTDVFHVTSTGAATLIAGVSIDILPGTTVDAGGYLLGRIGGSWCGGKSATIPEVSAVTEEAPVSFNQASFTLYPNPTTGNFTLVQKGNSLYSNVNVEVYNMRGTRVMTDRMIGEKSHEFRFSEIPDGLYFVKVVADNYVETIKLIKTR